MSDRRPDDIEDLARELDGERDGEAEPSAEELEAAARLRDVLRAAGVPGRLAEDLNERLLSRALGLDDTALASEPAALAAELPVEKVEQRAATRLGVRLERGLRRDPDAEPDDAVEALVEVASTLRNAYAPSRLDQLAAERALQRASLGRATRHSSSRGARLGWGVALAAAAAAAIAILPRTGLLPGESPATAALVPARSTQELFDPAQPFPREGGASDRIDRIAAARRSDLRQNRFARWGIR